VVAQMKIRPGPGRRRPGNLFMCEIPSNVICADQFADIFAVSPFGSNDLTSWLSVLTGILPWWGPSL